MGNKKEIKKERKRTERKFKSAPFEHVKDSNMAVVT